ncbi:hypothetical protein D7B12_18160 [Salmonella enterica]|nr:hypothetical protein [Salmonella enterica]
MKIASLLIMTSMLLLSGCSTTAVNPQTASKVETKIYQDKNGTVPVTIVRDSGIISARCPMTVFINGRIIADLMPSEKVEVFLKPGNAMIGLAQLGPGICTGPGRNERDYQIIEGQPRYIRASMDDGGNLDTKPMTLNQSFDGHIM